jgi:cytochrome c553
MEKQSENKSPVMSDVLQSDHQAHMTDEEIAKARAHHAKRHAGEPPNGASTQKAQGKKIPVKPR